MNNLIIHHWDTDGITSAALIAEMLEEKGEGWENVSPPIGVFDITEDMIREAEKTYVLDLNLPDKVTDIPGEVVFIDHHVQKRTDEKRIEHINPLLDGASGDDYPCASWIIAEHLDKWNFLSALGALGDKGKDAISLPIGDKISSLLEKEGLSSQEALELVTLIDSNYIVMDKKAVEDAVKEVKEKDGRQLLEKKEWIGNITSIEDEVRRVLDDMADKGEKAVADFKSDYNIISRIAREGAWNMGYKACFAVNRAFGDKAQVYFRLKPEAVSDYDIPSIIQTLKSDGINAGGKPEVVGVICSQDDLEGVLDTFSEMAGIDGL